MLHAKCEKGSVVLVLFYYPWIIYLASNCAESWLFWPFLYIFWPNPINLSRFSACVPDTAFHFLICWDVVCNMYSRTIWEVILASFERCRCKFQKRFIWQQTRHNCKLQGLHLLPTFKKAWLLFVEKKLSKIPCIVYLIFSCFLTTLDAVWTKFLSCWKINSHNQCKFYH